MWGPCGETIEIRQREAIEIRQKREAIEIRQSIGGGRANDGQGGRTPLSPSLGSKAPAVSPQAVYLLAFLYPVYQPPAFLTCQPSRKIFPRRPSAKQKKRPRVDDPATTLARLPVQIRLKSWTYMVNDQLFSAVSRTAGNA